MDGNSYLKAVNIEWDVDHAEDLDSLPKEVQIPAGMVDPDVISDYLSDLTGFCHKRFELRKEHWYQVKLCYGYEQNEDGTIFHAFEAIDTDECPSEMAVDKRLLEVLEAEEDDFDWDWMFIALPEKTVAKIQSEALEEITVALAKSTASHAEDKLALLKIISSLEGKLSAADACIDEVNRALTRGTDSALVQDIIARYQQQKTE